MARYLISFPAHAMTAPTADLDAIAGDAHAVVEQAKAAGVYVFAGGLDDRVPVTLVAADGTSTDGGHPGGPALDGGFAIFELPTRDAAIEWAARLARACRCAQELRVFGIDAAS
jgi:hypothetical protein